MSFHSRNTAGHGGGNESFWTSYSDLFLGLSAIFLLLYVVSTMRTGADTIKQQFENEQLKMKVTDLQNQIQFYEQAKNEYMQKSAAKDEVAEYQELMDKLTLLQDEAKTENAKLQQKMAENMAKEKALNKYQQMVRNVINSSKFEKVKVSNRDVVIGEKNEEIQTQTKEIGELKTELTEKQQAIVQTEEQLKEAKHAIEKRKADLAAALKAQKITRKVYEQRLAASKAQAENQIKELHEKQGLYKEQLNALNGQLAQMGEQVQGLSGELNATKGQLSAKEAEAQGLHKKLVETHKNAEAKIAGLKAGYDAEKEGLKKGFAAEKAGLEAEKARKEAELNATRGQLAKAQAEIDARKSVARNIKAAFDKKGIKAEVDMESGEVFLDFGQSYFDNGSAQLKEEMKKVIERAMPLYAKSLFGDPKIAQKVSTVEIIGFASPTYKGKFVDPNSTRKEDREALKYNMDLSYKRAKSIFNYMLDEDNSSFSHQKDLKPLLKVSGRSFLETAKVNRNVASEDFCKVNDCKKAQRVVIRFSMDNKK